MDIRQLEYFREVATIKSITQSAQKLYVSQPTITVALQKLEQELDIALFDRNKKQFTLTKEGALFLEKVSDILNKLQAAVTEIREHKNLQKGYLRIGIPPLVGAGLFPAIITNFASIHALLNLDILEDGSRNIREYIKQDTLDVGIINLMNLTDDFFSIPISRQELLVCLHHEHPLAEYEEIDLQQLATEKLILFNETNYNRHLIMQEFLSQDIVPRVILSTSQIATMQSLVSKNLGICFLTREVIPPSSTMVDRSLKKKLFLEFGLAWHKEKILSPAAKAFIEFIKVDYLHK